MKIDFLAHSGFMLTEGNKSYVFDYWQDPLNHVEKAFKNGQEMWFFVTHIHADHFTPAIKNFDRNSTKYILHEDINFNVEQGEVYKMAVGDFVELENISIKMFGSTDEGGSFLVNTGDKTIFHAGDLNWWHWLGDTPENNAEARLMFEHELKRMNGVECDIAFFPVDSRLNFEDPTKEGAREWGVLEWLDVVKVHELFVPMHQHDLAKGGWQPSLHFKAKYHDLSLWIPRIDGESIDLERI